MVGSGDSEQGRHIPLQAGLSGEELFPTIYDDLRRLAARKLSTIGPGQTLQATALVHEAWLRLAKKDGDWRSRTHFFAVAAELIRHILIDHLRRKDRLKRGGGVVHLSLDSVDLASAGPDEKVLLIEDALKQLEIEHPDKARVVVLKFFGGLTDREAAENLGVTGRTIERHWAYAKAWLIAKIESDRKAAPFHKA